MNAVRSNSSRPLTAATRETVQLAPVSIANLASGDGAAAAQAAAGAQPQIEPGRAGGRICPHSKLPKIEAVTVRTKAQLLAGYRRLKVVSVIEGPGPGPGWGRI